MSFLWSPSNIARCCTLKSQYTVAEFAVRSLLCHHRRRRRRRHRSHSLRLAIVDLIVFSWFCVLFSNMFVGCMAWVVKCLLSLTCVIHCWYLHCAIIVFNRSSSYNITSRLPVKFAQLLQNQLPIVVCRCYCRILSLNFALLLIREKRISLKMLIWECACACMFAFVCNMPA